LQEEKNELQEFERDIVYWRSNYETSWRKRTKLKNKVRGNKLKAQLWSKCM
jgi:hypothetical protein